MYELQEYWFIKLYFIIIFSIYKPCLKVSLRWSIYYNEILSYLN